MNLAGRYKIVHGVLTVGGRRVGAGAVVELGADDAFGALRGRLIVPHDDATKALVRASLAAIDATVHEINTNASIAFVRWRTWALASLDENPEALRRAIAAHLSKDATYNYFPKAERK